MKKLIADPKRGQVLTARYLGEVVDTCNRFNRFTVSGGATWDSGTSSLHVNTNDIVWGVTGPAGIAAASGATMSAGPVDLYAVDNLTRVPAGTTVKAVNGATGGAVGGNRWVLVALVGGRWTVIWEDCAATAGDEPGGGGPSPNPTPTERGICGFTAGFSAGFGNSDCGADTGPPDGGFDDGFDDGFGGTPTAAVVGIASTLVVPMPSAAVSVDAVVGVPSSLVVGPITASTEVSVGISSTLVVGPVSASTTPVISVTVGIPSTLVVGPVVASPTVPATVGKASSLVVGPVHVVSSVPATAGIASGLLAGPLSRVDSISVIVGRASTLVLGSPLSNQEEGS